MASQPGENENLISGMEGGDERALTELFAR